MTQWNEFINFFQLQEAEGINAAIGSLPIAETKPIMVDGVVVPEYVATVVKGKVIDIPSAKYVLTQHEEAFRPVIEGLTVSGVANFKYTLWASNKRANMAVFVGEVDKGVNYGFRVKNSFDRSSSIDYGFNAMQINQKVEVVEREHVLVWTYRQICKNGAIMKVPLKTCKYLDSVTVTKFKELLSVKKNIKHIGEVSQKVNEMQYITEAFMLLRQPLNAMILDAQKISVTQEKAEALIEKYVGKRKMERYLELYGKEEQTLWGLFNSLTYYASHNGVDTNRKREKLLQKASDLLEGELIV